MCRSQTDHSFIHQVLQFQRICHFKTLRSNRVTRRSGLVVSWTWPNWDIRVCNSSMRTRDAEWAEWWQMGMEDYERWATTSSVMRDVARIISWHLVVRSQLCRVGVKFMRRCWRHVDDSLIATSCLQQLRTLISGLRRRRRNVRHFWHFTIVLVTVRKYKFSTTVQTRYLTGWRQNLSTYTQQFEELQMVYVLFRLISLFRHMYSRLSWLYLQVYERIRYASCVHTRPYP